MATNRMKVQQEVADALVAAKAIDFEAIGSVLSRHAAAASLAGQDIAFIFGHHVIDICIPPDPYRGVVLAGLAGAVERQSEAG
jgi:hypothetical protein